MILRLLACVSIKMRLPLGEKFGDFMTPCRSSQFGCSFLFRSAALGRVWRSCCSVGQCVLYSEKIKCRKTHPCDLVIFDQ